MGHNTPLDLEKEFRLQLSRPLSVFAVSEQIEALRASRSVSWVGDADFHALALDAPISTDAIETGRIIIVQVDTRVPQSMERIRRVRQTRPDLIQIVALDNADARMVRTLVRDGVTDVVGLPLDPEEILQVAVAVAEVASQRDTQESALAPLIAITRSSGGGGATTIATHLASVLTQKGESGKTCCIVDLDIQFGQVAEFMGARPKRTLADLIEAGDRLDSTMVRSVAVEVGHGVSVVAAPFEIVPVESLEPAIIQSVIEIVCREYDYVVIDMPADLTNWGLSLLARTDMIVLLCQQSLPSLRQARRRVDLFRNVGINMRNVALIANQVERKLFGSLGLSTIAEAVGHDVLGGIALDEKVVQAAQDQGILADRVKAGSSFVTDLKKIGDQLRERLDMARKL
jgi:pilus assembly protein CpaE